MLLARQPPQAYVITSAGLFTDKLNTVSKRPQEVKLTSASCGIFAQTLETVLMLFGSSQARRCDKIAQNMLQYGCWPTCILQTIFAFVSCDLLTRSTIQAYMAVSAIHSVSCIYVACPSSGIFMLPFLLHCR